MAHESIFLQNVDPEFKALDLDQVWVGVAHDPKRVANSDLDGSRVFYLNISVHRKLFFDLCGPPFEFFF